MDQERPLTKTQEFFRRVSDSPTYKEVKRTAPPWGVFVIAAVAMGIAVCCMVIAFGG